FNIYSDCKLYQKSDTSISFCTNSGRSLKFGVSTLPDHAAVSPHLSDWYSAIDLLARCRQRILLRYATTQPNNIAIHSLTSLNTTTWVLSDDYQLTEWVMVRHNTRGNRSCELKSLRKIVINSLGSLGGVVRTYLNILCVGI